MKTEKLSVLSSPYIGVFCLATENALLVPYGAEEKSVREMEAALGVKAKRQSIASSTLIGALCAGNSQGIIVPEIITLQEESLLKKNGVRFLVVDGVMALGNLVTANDKGGIVSPLVPERSRKQIEEFLKVKLRKTILAGTDVAGSCVIASNSGFCCHPETSKEEFTELEKAFGVRGTVSTANYGDGFVKNGVLANSHGIVVGTATSVSELSRIEEGMEADSE
ncbi:MAG: translation initiation factor IF-6 [archaeon]